jgi:hypothetical protein
MLQPGGLITDDRSETVFRGRTRKRPYLSVLPLVAALAVIAILGALGPRPHQAGAAPEGSGEAAVRASDAAGDRPPVTVPPSSGAVFAYDTPEPTEIAPGVGLARMKLDDTSLRTALLSVSGNPAIAFRGHVVYIGGNEEVNRVDFDGSGRPQLIASMDLGYTVVDITTTAGKVLVLAARAQAVAATCAEGFCPVATGLDWEVLVVDPDGTAGVVVERFATPEDQSAWVSPRLAGTDRLWAVSRPGSSNGVTAIEVHAETGELLWSTSTEASVMDLSLGGSRLGAVLTEPGDGGSRYEATADASDPSLRRLANVAWGASLSSDGSVLAWDDAGCILTEDGTTGRRACPEGPASPPPSVFGSPMVDVWDGKPIVAWEVDGANGVWLALSSDRLGPDVWLADAGSPSWFGVHGSVVVWAAFTKAGIEIHEVDLSTAGYQIE